MQQTPFIELGYFADTTGYLMALCYNRAVVGGRQHLLTLVSAREIDMTQRPWYRTVSRERRAALTQPYESLQHTGHVFTVAAPVYGRVCAYASNSARARPSPSRPSLVMHQSFTQIATS